MLKATTGKLCKKVEAPSFTRPLIAVISAAETVHAGEVDDDVVVEVATAVVVVVVLEVVVPRRKLITG